MTSHCEWLTSEEDEMDLDGDGDDNKMIQLILNSLSGDIKAYLMDEREQMKRKSTTKCDNNDGDQVKDIIIELRRGTCMKKQNPTYR